MREGLNPIETGKKLYEHGEEQKSEEEHGQDTAEDRHSRIVQIGEAVLLALVTSRPPGRAIQRRSGAPHHASRSLSPRHCATWLPAMT